MAPGSVAENRLQTLSGLTSGGERHFGEMLRAQIGERPQASSGGRGSRLLEREALVSLAVRAGQVSPLTLPFDRFRQAAPPQVYRFGIAPLSANAADVRTKAMATPQETTRVDRIR